MEGWQVLNADLEFESKPGWGYQGGVELLVNISRSIGLTFEVNYLAGGSAIPITGSYSGGNSGSFQTVNVDYEDAQVDLTGWEISLGAVFNGR